jgi:hypothetical protein
MEVGRELQVNGITEEVQGRTRLIGSEELRDSEHDEQLQMCRTRLNSFRA